MPEIPDLTAVRLTETVEGIEAGSYGTVVHVYQGSTLAETGYAVEFSNPSRVVVVARSQIEPVWTEEDLRAADARAEELHRYFHPAVDQSTQAERPSSPRDWRQAYLDMNHIVQPKIGLALVALRNGDAEKAKKHLDEANQQWPEPAERPAPPAADHTERARRVIALVENCAGDTALLVGAIAAEFSEAVMSETEAIRAANWAWAKKCQNAIAEIERLRADLKRVGAGWEAVEQARHNLTLMLQDRDARLARLQDPAVRQAVINALMATGGWVSSFPGELRSVAAALTDAAIAKIKEMLK